MAATFDQALPTAKDRVRRALGDADITDAIRQDEEYAAQLARTTDERETIAIMAEGLAAEYARKPDSLSDADGSISWRERVKTWLELAKRMRDGMAGEIAVGSQTAVSVAVDRDSEQLGEYDRHGYYGHGGRAWYTG